MTHFAIRAVMALGLVVAGACSSGDDDTPTDDSQLDEVRAALCDAYGSAGSMVLDGEVYDMSDCP